jgi:hypothetical protein
VPRTNTELNPLEAMLCYKQLWVVEHTFRTVKHLLAGRRLLKRHRGSPKAGIAFTQRSDCFRSPISRQAGADGRGVYRCLPEGRAFGSKVRF